MPLFTWTDKVAVGNAEIDSQHKQLFAMFNDLHEAMNGGKHEETKRILNGLTKYTVDHFSMEQNLMARHPYPGEAKHREAHKRFIDQIKIYQSDVESKTLTTTLNLAQFLKDWLVGHIAAIDTEFAKHLRDKGIK